MPTVQHDQGSNHSPPDAVTTPFLIQIRYLSHQMHDMSNQIGTKSNQIGTMSKQFRTKSKHF